MNNLSHLTDEELYKELERREQIRRQGKCPHCEKPLSTLRQKALDSCRFHETYLGEDSGRVLPRRVKVIRN